MPHYLIILMKLRSSAEQHLSTAVTSARAHSWHRRNPSVGINGILYDGQQCRPIPFAEEDRAVTLAMDGRSLHASQCPAGPQGQPGQTSHCRHLCRHCFPPLHWLLSASLQQRPGAYLEIEEKRNAQTTWGEQRYVTCLACSFTDRALSSWRVLWYGCTRKHESRLIF